MHRVVSDKADKPGLAALISSQLSPGNLQEHSSDLLGQFLKGRLKFCCKGWCGVCVCMCFLM